MNFKTTDKMFLRTTSIYAECNKKTSTLKQCNHCFHFNRMEELHYREEKKKNEKKVNFYFSSINNVYTKGKHILQVKKYLFQYKLTKTFTKFLKSLSHRNDKT